ncbi:hypothetical protein ABN363_19940 [Providencia rettgeri]
MGHRESDVLPLAIRQNMPLLGNPLFGALEASGTAGFGFTGLTKKRESVHSGEEQQ